MTDLTLSEVEERTGITRTALVDLCNAGRLPGARKVRGGAWAVPPEALAALAYNGDDPGTLAGAGADPDNDLTTATGALAAVEPTVEVARLVDVARRVERVLADLSTSRPARAAADLVWRQVQAAARHEADRDGTCRTCGWQAPCPDRVDAATAVLDAARVILDGGAS